MNEPQESKKAHFRQAYAGQTPWDIGQPQPVFVQNASRIRGTILDAGCGAGDNAMFFAERGHDVLGVDFLEQPIARAKQQAARRNLKVRFQVIDALKLAELNATWDNVIDSGLFHVFSDEDRAAYVAQLAKVVGQGGNFWMLCFSDKEPPGYGPRRVSRQEIHDAFTDGWEVESIEDARFKAATGSEVERVSQGGPRAYFAVIRRVA